MTIPALETVGTRSGSGNGGGPWFTPRRVPKACLVKCLVHGLNDLDILRAHDTHNAPRVRESHREVWLRQDGQVVRERVRELPRGWRI